VGCNMDVREAVEQAEKEFNAGNNRGAIALLLPWLRPPGQEKLPHQERNMVGWLSVCYRALLDFEAALPHAQRCVDLTQRVQGGVRSLQYARALKGLCMVHLGLKDFPAARSVVTEALTIMEELGLQQEQQYGAMLSMLGTVVLEQGRYAEALFFFGKAKIVLAQYKEGLEGCALVGSMAICHEQLHQWNDAVACYLDTVERYRKLYGTEHTECATALHNLAVLYIRLRQYEEAIPRFEEALCIFHRVLGDKHERTLDTATELVVVRQFAQQPRQEMIDVGRHDYRMCSECGAFKENLEVCNGCFRAWYCDTDCQLRHWPTHELMCNVCLHCDTVLSKIMQCSRCKKAKYCDVECQRAHWSEHKKDCVAPTRK
jgi:tetratricopeptide (TPR) repeat protein